MRFSEKSIIDGLQFLRDSRIILLCRRRTDIRVCILQLYEYLRKCEVQLHIQQKSRLEQEKCISKQKSELQHILSIQKLVAQQ